MNDTKNSGTRLGVRAFARHRGVAPSRIHRLAVAGVIQRDAQGLIDVLAADQILDERASIVSPLVTLANEETKRLRRAAAQPSLAPALKDAHSSPAADERLAREVAVVNEIGALARRDFGRYGELLRVAYLALSDEQQDRVAFPEEVWDQLCGTAPPAPESAGAPDSERG